MQVNDELIDKLATLSRLEFDVEEKKEIKKDLARILDFVEKINELGLENVEPLIFMSSEVNMLREDEVKIAITQDDALLNAPKHDSDYFKAPRVIGKNN
jgi:aspartyl-tRNA(Asn)/glutamyl-tRNA(Gln) amidotransferase subunit C